MEIKNKVLSLKEAKEYLRLDSDDEDSFIQLLIEYSKETIKNSTGVIYNPNGNSYTYIITQLMIITDRYENRGSQDLEIKPNNCLSSLYTKLKYGVKNHE